jgi:hypothetical protein
MPQSPDAAASGGGAEQPVHPSEPGAAAGPRRFLSADVLAIVVAAVFALLAVGRLLPDIPWDSVNIPTISW